MANGITLKVYNKDDKLNILIRETEFIKTVSIYKYNGETIDIHTYTHAKGNGELKKWHPYYEMRVDVAGVMKETFMVSSEFIEHNEYISNTSFIRTTTNLDSGNVYENRTKYFEGEKYTSEFKNGQLHDFPVRLQETKIKEYLKTIQNGK